MSPECWRERGRLLRSAAAVQVDVIPCITTCCFLLVKTLMVFYTGIRLELYRLSV